ncbi:hypothetical protein DFH29DRAFT_1001263 [Suillus ampliporus]|nr:hypothetical protein DFH29DRAFT_1001263 [Suillus ampliporus]
MEFVPSSPVPSPPRSSSPAPTNSSSATRVEPPSSDFFKKTSHSYRDSPHVMTSEIGSGSDTGSLHIPLSPVDEVPKPPGAKQSLLYKSPNRSLSYRQLLKSPLCRGKPDHKSPSWKGNHGLKLFTSPSRCGQYLRERSSKQHIPYALHPAPLELRFAARASGRGCKPEFTAEEIHEREDAMFRGFSQLSFATLYSLFKSKLAGREAAHQRLVTMAWELEESERFTTFLDGVQRENKNRLLFSDEELKQIRNTFCDQTQEQIDDDTNYLQAIYEDDCEILRAVAAQAEVLSKHLGSRVKEDVLGSMGESSHSPQFVGPSSNTDDSMDDDEGTGDDEGDEEDDAIDG